MARQRKPDPRRQRTCDRCRRVGQWERLVLRVDDAAADGHYCRPCSRRVIEEVVRSGTGPVAKAIRAYFDVVVGDV